MAAVTIILSIEACPPPQGWVQIRESLKCQDEKRETPDLCITEPLTRILGCPWSLVPVFRLALQSWRHLAPRVGSRPAVAFLPCEVAEISGRWPCCLGIFETSPQNSLERKIFLFPRFLPQEHRLEPRQQVAYTPRLHSPCSAMEKAQALPGSPSPERGPASESHSTSSSLNLGFFSASEDTPSTLRF